MTEPDTIDQSARIRVSVRLSAPGARVIDEFGAPTRSDRSRTIRALLAAALSNPQASADAARRLETDL